MKKLILVLMLGMLSGCALLSQGQQCTPAATADLAMMQNVTSGIQTYYTPLQAMAAVGVNVVLPGAGGMVAQGVSLALSAADQALKNLGEMQTTKCADATKIALAQQALIDLEKFMATQEVKQALNTPAVKATLRMMKSVGK